MEREKEASEEGTKVCSKCGRNIGSVYLAEKQMSTSRTLAICKECASYQPQRTFIYGLFDPRTEECRYVGKTNRPKRRFYHHVKRTNMIRIKRWVIELADSGLIPRMEILEECPMEIWQQRETFWIAHYRSQGADLLNLTSGGDGISSHSEEVRMRLGALHRGKNISLAMRQRLSEFNRGRKHSPEVKAKIAAANTGRLSPNKGKPIHGPEVRQRIAEANRGKTVSETTRGKLSNAQKGRKLSEWVRQRISEGHKGLPGPNKGRKFGPETRAKQSAARKGKKRPPEVGAKVSAAQKGKKLSPEHCAKMSAALKGRKLPDRVSKKGGQAMKRKMESDPEFKEQQINRLRAFWNDPEVKRKRAEGNRRRLMPVRLEYAKWLATPVGERQISSQSAFIRMFGISETAVLKWKKDPQFLELVERIRRELRPAGNEGQNG